MHGDELNWFKWKGAWEIAVEVTATAIVHEYIMNWLHWFCWQCRYIHTNARTLLLTWSAHLGRMENASEQRYQHTFEIERRKATTELGESKTHRHRSATAVAVAPTANAVKIETLQYKPYSRAPHAHSMCNGKRYKWSDVVSTMRCMSCIWTIQQETQAHTMSEMISRNKLTEYSPCPMHCCWITIRIHRYTTQTHTCICMLFHICWLLSFYPCVELC